MKILEDQDLEYTTESTMCDSCENITEHQQAHAPQNCHLVHCDSLLDTMKLESFTEKADKISVEKLQEFLNKF